MKGKEQKSKKKCFTWKWAKKECYKNWFIFLNWFLQPCFPTWILFYETLLEELPWSSSPSLAQKRDFFFFLCFQLISHFTLFYFFFFTSKVFY